MKDYIRCQRNPLRKGYLVVIAEADGTDIDRIVGTTPTIGEYITVLESIIQ